MSRHEHYLVMRLLCSSDGAPHFTAIDCLFIAYGSGHNRRRRALSPSGARDPRPSAPLIHDTHVVHKVLDLVSSLAYLLSMPATQPTRTFVAIDLCDRLLFAADCLRHDGLVDAADLAALLVEAVDRLRHLSPMTPAVPADMSGSVVVGEDGEPEQFAITFADYVAERRTQKGGK